MEEEEDGEKSSASPSRPPPPFPYMREGGLSFTQREKPQVSNLFLTAKGRKRGGGGGPQDNDPVTEDEEEEERGPMCVRTSCIAW